MCACCRVNTLHSKVKQFPCTLTFVPVLQRRHHKEPNSLVGALFEDRRCHALICPLESCSHRKPEVKNDTHAQSQLFLLRLSSRGQFNYTWGSVALLFLWKVTLLWFCLNTSSVLCFNSSKKNVVHERSFINTVWFDWGRPLPWDLTISPTPWKKPLYLGLAEVWSWINLTLGDKGRGTRSSEQKPFLWRADMFLFSLNRSRKQTFTRESVNEL